MIPIILHEPLIPSNTGNIGRLCAAFQAPLHLIHPLGFEITEKRVRRAGLDYWPFVKVYEHPNLEHGLSSIKPRRLICLETYGQDNVYHFQFEKGDALMFGKETTGVPQSLIDELAQIYPIHVLKIQQLSNNVRSLNLANCVAIALSYASHQLSNRANQTIEEDHPDLTLPTQAKSAQILLS